VYSGPRSLLICPWALAEKPLSQVYVLVYVPSLTQTYNAGVSPDTQEPSNAAEDRLRHYAEILNPLFWNDSFNNMNLLFEFACSLVRASGMKDTGWESYNESLSFLEDMRRLGEIDLPTEVFPEPLHTRARLALVAYGHATEMKTHYELLANLLRLRLGKKYCIHPFAHLATRRTRKINGAKTYKIITPSPEKKIALIEELSAQAGLPGVGAALREIHDPVIRNAVFHSDYVLHGTSMRLLSDYWKSPTSQVRTPMIQFHDIGQIDYKCVRVSLCIDCTVPSCSQIDDRFSRQVSSLRPTLQRNLRVHL